MNAKAMAIMLFWGILGGLWAQPVTDWQKLELKGKVQALVEEAAIKYFSTDGYLLKQEYSWGLGGVIEYSYNDLGSLVSEKNTGSNGVVTLERTNEYDESGALISTKDKTLSNTTTDKFTYYEENYKVHWKKTYDFYDKLSHAVEYFYDAKIHCTKENHYDKAMKLMHYLEYSYDDKGNILEAKTFEPNKTLIRKFVYTYNDKNMKVSEKVYQGKTLSSESTFAYDDFGNLIQKTVHQPEYYMTTKLSYSYTYDDMGNWLEMNTYNGDTLQDSQIREIYYFQE